MGEEEGGAGQVDGRGNMNQKSCGGGDGGGKSRKPNDKPGNTAL